MPRSGRGDRCWFWWIFTTAFREKAAAKTRIKGDSPLDMRSWRPSLSLTCLPVLQVWCRSAPGYLRFKQAVRTDGSTNHVSISVGTELCQPRLSDRWTSKEWLHGMISIENDIGNISVLKNYACFTPYLRFEEASNGWRSRSRKRVVKTEPLLVLLTNGYVGAPRKLYASRSIMSSSANYTFGRSFFEPAGRYSERTSGCEDGFLTLQDI